MTGARAVIGVVLLSSIAFWSLLPVQGSGLGQIAPRLQGCGRGNIWRAQQGNQLARTIKVDFGTGAGVFENTREATVPAAVDPNNVAPWRQHVPSYCWSSLVGGRIRFTYTLVKLRKGAGTERGFRWPGRVVRQA